MGSFCVNYNDKAESYHINSYYIYIYTAVGIIYTGQLPSSLAQKFGRKPVRGVLMCYFQRYYDILNARKPNAEAWGTVICALKLADRMINET
jgi:hypothetical protein